jgi:hypothetical protein
MPLWSGQRQMYFFSTISIHGKWLRKYQISDKYLSVGLLRIMDTRWPKGIRHTDLWKATGEKPVILHIEKRMATDLSYCKVGGGGVIRIRREPEGEDWGKPEREPFGRKEESVAKYGARLRSWRARESDGSDSQMERKDILLMPLLLLLLQLLYYTLIKWKIAYITAYPNWKLFLPFFFSYITLIELVISYVETAF